MTTPTAKLKSPHGTDPRVVIERIDGSEPRRLVYPVDAAEFVATGQWRRVTTIQHDPAEHGAEPLACSGSAAAKGEGMAMPHALSGALVERDRVVATAEYEGWPPAPID